MGTGLAQVAVSDYGLDDQAIGVRSPAGQRIFPLACVQTSSGAHSAYCTMGTGGPFPGGKARTGRDADHSPPSSAEVELYSSPPNASMACKGTALPFYINKSYIIWTLGLRCFSSHTPTEHHAPPPYRPRVG
jgi:hypothetical protein